MLAGVFLVKANAPGTVPGGGLGRVAGFTVWAGWYFAITIAMLYVANTARQVPTQRIVRLLGWMFVVTTGFGVLAVLAPTLEFQSPMEMVLPKQLVSTNFVRTLVHPSLASSSDFLGYVQPRPTAPFPYSNAWGNNLALYLPFFILAWFGRDAGWRRKVGPFVILIAAIFPITFSLNRGLWISLALAAVYAAVRLAVNGAAGPSSSWSPPWSSAASSSSPRRSTTRWSCGSRPRTATTAGPAPPRRSSSVTAEGSPLVGYGTTRTMQGSFSSLAGGETADVPPVRCAAAGHPGLHVAAGPHHRFRRHRPVPGVLRLPVPPPGPRARTRCDVAAAPSCSVAVLCFFVYDSLGSAMFTALIADRADGPSDDLTTEIEPTSARQ